jgi:hypothetical protein
MAPAVRRPLPLAGLVAVVCSAMVCGAVLAGCGGGGADPADTTTAAPTTTVAPTVPPPPGEAVGWADLGVGDCFDAVTDPDAADLAALRIDCAAPHRYEVYDVVELDLELPVGGGYPGAEAVRRRAEELCVERFEAFVGVRWTVSELDLEAWWPSESSWGRGDSSVICAVMELSGDAMTGTQRGTAR